MLEKRVVLKYKTNFAITNRIVAYILAEK